MEFVLHCVVRIRKLGFTVKLEPRGQKIKILTANDQTDAFSLFSKWGSSPPLFCLFRKEVLFFLLWQLAAFALWGLTSPFVCRLFPS